MPVLEAPRPYAGNVVADAWDRTSFYLTMSDGTKLAVDLYLPRDRTPDTRLPAILHQTRYWRSIDYRWPLSLFNGDRPRGLMAAYAERFLANGYAWIDVDVRGSGASFGTRPYAYSPQEIRDGTEIVEWIVRQPWSNGRVGALGISYNGTAAEFLLLNHHPAVKAVAPMFSAFDLYPEIVFPGGIHLAWFTSTWTWINRHLDANELPFGGWVSRFFLRGVRPVDQDVDRRLLRQAVAEHAANWNPHREAEGLIFRDDPPPSQMTTSIDQLSPRTYAETIRRTEVPVYSYSGWFDGGYALAAIKRYLAYRNPGDKLIIGPWDHGGKRRISPGHLGPATFDHAGELLKFFDAHLKGIDTGISDEPPIHYYTMGQEQWNATDIWPPSSTPLTLFLSPDKTLTDEPPSSAAAPLTYQMDLTTGTGHQTRWDTLIGTSLTNPYPDRAERDTRLLTFTSSPLEVDLEVTGHPVVTLRVRSSARDLAVFAYLEDVDETGRVTYVTEGMLRALHRRLHDPPADWIPGVPYRTYLRKDAQPMEPDIPATLVFDLLPTSYEFKRHHRIRLALAGADRDHFAPVSENPPTIVILPSSSLRLPIIRARDEDSPSLHNKDLR
ncbi:MAG: CocE/NonD family hydrolase [Nitrospirae bacterium]|nr:MAG: CocE/NonD family hydrolase [Nitrospirota bacterium]